MTVNTPPRSPLLSPPASPNTISPLTLSPTTASSPVYSTFWLQCGTERIPLPFQSNNALELPEEWSFNPKTFKSYPAVVSCINDLMQRWQDLHSDSEQESTEESREENKFVCKKIDSNTELKDLQNLVHAFTAVMRNADTSLQTCTSKSAPQTHKNLMITQLTDYVLGKLRP